MSRYCFASKLIFSLNSLKMIAILKKIYTISYLLWRVIFYNFNTTLTHPSFRCLVLSYSLANALHHFNKMTLAEPCITNVFIQYFPFIFCLVPKRKYINGVYNIEFAILVFYCFI